MSLVQEFKAFAMRGNVVDMAVGIIIGGAFGKIVSSVVSDVIMPPIGLLLGGVKFTDLKIIMKDPIIDAAGVITTQAVSINYGNFIQTTVDFLIIAFAIFMMIKAMNSMKKKEVVAPVEAPPPPPPSNEEVLLAEIRDLLKKK
jgi:large conductance mechanosensitive channel